MLHKAWNSKGEKPYCFSRSSIKFQVHRGQNITDFDPNWAFPDYRPVAAFKSLRFALFQLWHGFFQKVFIMNTWNVCDICARKLGHSDCFQYGLCSAATKQLYEWFNPSVRLSVTPFWLCSHHPIIMKFSGVITSDKSDVHAKGQGQRSKVKVTEVTTQLHRFRTLTPVWIHIWWWDDAYSLIMLRRGALLFFKVIGQISRSHGSKNRRIWPRLGVSGL